MAKLSSKKKLAIIIAAVITVAIVAGVFVWYLFIRSTGPKFVWKPLDEVLAEAPDALKKTYDNLILPDSISLDDPTALHNISFNILNGMSLEETKQKCVDLSNAYNSFIISANDVKTEDLYQSIDSGRWFDCRYYCTDREEKGSYSCSFESDDVIILWSFDIMSETGSGSYPSREACYEVGIDDLSSVVYTVDGQEYSAHQALEFADTVVNGKLAEFIECEELVPNYVIAAKNEENDYYTYFVQYAYYYDGIELNTAGSSSAPNDIRMQQAYLEVMISSPNTLTQIMDLGMTENMTFTELDDSFITLESALDCTSYLLAEYFVHEISDIDIVYAAIATSGLKEENYIRDYRPMWRLTVANDNISNNVTATGEAMVPARYCIYVDMQNGAIILFDDKTGEFISDTYSYDDETEYAYVQ